MAEKVGKIRIMPPAWDGAAATASSSPETGAHLLNMRRDHVWYSDAALEGQPLSDQTITVTWPQPVPIDTLVLDRHNISGSGTVQHRLLLDGVEQYDSGAAPAGHPIPAGLWIAGVHRVGETYDDQLPARVFEHHLSSVHYADTWEITISDPTNTDRQLMITRAPVGMSAELENNFSWGAELEWVDDTAFYDTVGGGLDSEQGEIHRQLMVSFDWQSESDRTYMHAELARSKARPLFVSAYPVNDDGGVESLAHHFSGYRVNNVKTARADALFGKSSVTFREG